VVSNSPEYCLQFVVTPGALGLPRPEVRALVAHGLAHVELGHRTTTGRRIPTRLGRYGAMPGEQQRLYTVEEEAAADRYAARLLNSVSLEPGGADCLALGAALERAAVERERWSEWTEMHPIGPTRAATARGYCRTER
jgi:hypothetical protein